MSEQQNINNEQEIKEENVVNTENDKINENNKEQNDSPEKEKKCKKRISRKIKIIIISILLILSIMIFSVIFSLLNINNDRILKGITILGIEVGDLSIEEAEAKINSVIEESLNNKNHNLILKNGQNEVSVTASTFNATFDVNTSVIEAFNIGRKGNIITNNYEILFTKILKKELKPTLYLEEELLSKTIIDISSKMKDAVVENSYYIEDKVLTIVRGKAGYIINKQKLSDEIYKQLEDIYNTYQIIEVPLEYKEPDPIDLEKIRSEIYKEPKDAYVEKNPTVVHTHVNGVDFGISMEEANKLIQQEKEEYEIPLKITKPKKTINDLGEEAFPDNLATFSTIYDASNRNRSTNIELATKKVNGTVIMPGETFSFNTIVGKRTIEAGYKEGTAYIGGKVVPDIGGGICQLSSTLYNAALLANLEIVERSNHIFLTGYVAASRDATVYYGSLDFVFKNTREYPIKIVASSKNGVCKTTIYGIKEKVEYEVIIQSKVLSYINPTTTYKEDASLEQGKEIVEESGSTGCRSEGYRILKLNGKVVSQTLLSKDTYSAQERVVRKGTKKVSTPVKKPTNVEKPANVENQNNEENSVNNEVNTNIEN